MVTKESLSTNELVDAPHTLCIIPCSTGRSRSSFRVHTGFSIE